ncbi:MAG: hypothetical protein K9I99_17920 [Melioribacteraceae bacterium]|nr:hypothetical protein [Melioribacteraceae bacterium]MCF8432692.1 hypothetical protein [Melioribacteraceae bacterium]
MIQMFMIVQVMGATIEEIERFHKILVQNGWFKYEGSQMTFFKFTDNESKKEINKEINADMNRTIKKLNLSCTVTVRFANQQWIAFKNPN